MDYLILQVSIGGCPSSAIVGVLLSTENSRSFSAPVLTADKRLPINPFTSFAPLHKPERSISPESNDSISEELNHFKPIVCSPCTPPKRLPDGRVQSPVIIKSTPRNLRKNLQKPTTYEASPVILKKWEQVFRDRQMKRTLSKGTLTSTAEGEEDGSTQNNRVSSCREQLETKKGVNVRDTSLGELVPSSSTGEGFLLHCKVRSRTLASSDGLSGADLLSETAGEGVNPSLLGDSKPIEAEKGKAIAKWKCLRVTPIKGPSKCSHKNNHQSVRSQNGTCFTAAKNVSPDYPQRRGQKRRCKTKHLEQNGSLKRLRMSCRGSCVQGFGLLWTDREKRLNQEESDKKLALKLQRMFDKETRRVKRCKGSREYSLRSKSTAGAN
ncbi:hypothetical protein GDO86_018040 [Hymenochirus boettgeri]|uniref:RING-type E3 ubiquitin transferase n=1 Tax=Hymenochirus boettgeri TaxID=247094 RepID=A0A8T2IGI7_9PIPI|nr:hypothetical protein GDO86_018040 [Hymenochirus boettgeri]